MDKLFSSHPDLLKKIKAIEYTPPAEYQIGFEQTMMDRAVKEYEKAYSKEFYRTYGYIPARGGVKTLIFSMFLHGGFFHLLFNLIFLFLCGYILEDYWGRILYLLFYISGGVVATLVHAAMFPDSYTPLVGASGAIAALMGAFFVRFFRTRIYFFYFILIVIRFWFGRFLAPAYIMLPLWLTTQVYFALTDDGTGTGVAFWAHIGGFNFGCLFALFIKFFQFEERVIAHAIDQKVTFFDAERDQLKLTTVRGNDPIEENGFERREQARIFLDEGKKGNALFECKRALVIHIKKKEDLEAMDYYLKMREEFPELTLKSDYQNTLVDLLEKYGKFKDAALACKNLIQEAKQTGDNKVLASAMVRYGCLIKEHFNKTDLADKLLKQAKQIDNDVVININKRPAPIQKSEKYVAATYLLSDTPSEVPLTPVKTRIISLNHISSCSSSHLPSVDPRNVSRTFSHPDGLIFEGSNPNPVPYKNLRFMTIFKFESDADLSLDLFVAGEMRPYRLKSSRIAYGDFVDKPVVKTQENFRQFVHHLFSVAPLLHTDKEGQLFMDGAKPKVFLNEITLNAYEKEIWSKLMDMNVDLIPKIIPDIKN